MPVPAERDDPGDRRPGVSAWRVCGGSILGNFRRAVRVGKIAFFMLSAALSTHVGAAAKFDAMDPLGTVRKGAVAKKRSIAIEVAPGDWGRADIRDIQRVLDSVAEQLSSDVGGAGDDL
ncbi:MAG TPA: hypothetical protein VFH22_15575, partial [Rhodocyclaceae bacterium]|nr:hypothetical protein [Rhodocyclaceae bacterium]